MASTNSHTSVRTIKEATGMEDSEIAQVWEKMGDSPFRKVLQYELEVRRDRERAALESMGPNEVPKQQGICSGLTIAINILARPSNVKHPS